MGAEQNNFQTDFYEKKGEAAKKSADLTPNDRNDFYDSFENGMPKRFEVGQGDNTPDKLAEIFEDTALDAGLGKAKSKAMALELVAKLSVAFDVDKLKVGDVITIDPGRLRDRTPKEIDEIQYLETRKPTATITFKTNKENSNYPGERTEHTFGVDLSQSVSELKRLYKGRDVTAGTRKALEAAKGDLNDMLKKANVPYTMYEAMGRTKNFWKKYESDFTRLQELGYVDSAVRFSGKDKSSREQAKTGNAMMKAVRELTAKLGGDPKKLNEYLESGIVGEGGRLILPLPDMLESRRLETSYFNSLPQDKKDTLRTLSATSTASPNLYLFFSPKLSGTGNYGLQILDGGQRIAIGEVNLIGEATKDVELTIKAVGKSREIQTGVLKFSAEGLDANDLLEKVKAEKERLMNLE